MSNPWDIDESQIPEDQRKQTRISRLRRVGIVLWSLTLSSLIVLVTIQTDNQSPTEIAITIGLAIGTALVAVGLGIGLLLLLRRFAILGKLIVGLIGLLMFFVVLPTVVSFAVDNISLFEGLRSPGDQPIEEVLQRLLDFTN